jgi:hypothetical protein
MCTPARYTPVQYSAASSSADSKLEVLSQLSERPLSSPLPLLCARLPLEGVRRSWCGAATECSAAVSGPSRVAQ